MTIQQQNKQIGTSKSPAAIMKKANKAAAGWRAAAASERLTAANKLKTYLRTHLDELAADIRLLTHKAPVDVITGEFQLLFEGISYYEKQIARLLKKQKRKSPFPYFTRSSYVVLEPYGTVLIFSPWNYPLQLSLLPAITALLCGNTVILKPSEMLPEFPRLIEPLLAAMNLPDGVFQIAEGGPEMGKALIEERPDKIFFTGSRNTGKEVFRRASELFISCDLELSGKDPLLVFEDCDVERAANAAVWGSFANGGQMCVSVERVYVHRSIYQEFLKHIIDKAHKLVQNEAAKSCFTTLPGFEAVQEQMKDALTNGAIIAAGGDYQEEILYMSPTVLVNVNHSMSIMNDETFGPVLPVMVFDTEEEAIKLANDSPFGLNAYVFSRDKNRIDRVISSLESGNVYVNDVILNISNMDLPFGGVKESGMGRYHAKEGINSFTRPKSVMKYKGKRKRNINWYPYSENTFSILKKWYTFWYR